MSTRTASHRDRTQAREHHPAAPMGTAPNLDPTPDLPAPSRRLDLSVSQIIGGSLAAATAAALGSRLGVVGTITGAAVASLVASVAGAVYTSSLESTRRRFSSALGTVRGGGEPRRLGPAARRVLVGAAVVFALTAAAVTATELMTGRSLDGDTGATTVSTTLQGSAQSAPGPREQSPDVVPTPSPPEPSVSPSPTSTEAPSADAVPSPTVVPSPTPTVSAPGADTGSAPEPSGPPDAGPSTDAPTSAPISGSPGPAEEPTDPGTPSELPPVAP